MLFLTWWQRHTLIFSYHMDMPKIYFDVPPVAHVKNIFNALLLRGHAKDILWRPSTTVTSERYRSLMFFSHVDVPKHTLMFFYHADMSRTYAYAILLHRLVKYIYTLPKFEESSKFIAKLTPIVTKCPGRHDAIAIVTPPFGQRWWLLPLLSRKGNGETSM